MAMYWTCEYGANHDIGEKCDCAMEKEMEEKKRLSMFEVEKESQQLKMIWGKNRREKAVY